MVWTVMFCWEKRTAALIWISAVRSDLNFIYFNVVNHHPTYPATLQDLIISTKSQLGAGLGKLSQTTNGKVLLIQLFGCNDSLCLGWEV